jgi:hypothetical protein
MSLLSDDHTRAAFNTPIARSTRSTGSRTCSAPGRRFPMIVRFVDLVVYMHIDEDGRRRIGDVQRLMGVDYILEWAA